MPSAPDEAADLRSSIAADAQLDRAGVAAN